MAVLNGMHRLAQLRLTLQDKPWHFAEQNRHKIDDYWQALSRANSAIWNGSALIAYDVGLSDGAFSASFMKTDYASFIAWRDWGYPDRDVYNCFGSAVIQSNDGALIYGCMAPDTLNAGLCYPPGGSLDMSDVLQDGAIDIPGSIARELTEETGLDAGEAEPGALWAVIDGQRISLARVLSFEQTADQLAERVRSHIAADTNPELTDAIILRHAGDLRYLMPDFARQLALYLLAD